MVMFAVMMHSIDLFSTTTKLPIKKVKRLWLYSLLSLLSWLQLILLLLKPSALKQVFSLFWESQLKLVFLSIFTLKLIHTRVIAIINKALLVKLDAVTPEVMIAHTLTLLINTIKIQETICNTSNIHSLVSLPSISLPWFSQSSKFAQPSQLKRKPLSLLLWTTLNKPQNKDSMIHFCTQTLIPRERSNNNHNTPNSSHTVNNHINTLIIMETTTTGIRSKHLTLLLILWLE